MTTPNRVTTTLETYRREGLLEGWEVSETPFTPMYRVAFPGGTREWDEREVTAFIEGVNAARTPTTRRLF